MNVMQIDFFFPLSFQELTEICNAFVTSFVKWIQLIRHLLYFKQIWKCNFGFLISFVSRMFYNQFQPMSLLDISVVKFLLRILKMCLLISKVYAFQYHWVNLLHKDTIYSVVHISIPPRFLLEIRIIIEILKNPWYPINCD